MNYFDFSGQSVFVTGATGGIGGAIFDKFYKCGAKVFATSTNQAKLDSFLSKYEDKSRVFGSVLNMTNTEEVEEIIGKANSEMGGLDVVVCNAGITKDTLAMRMKTSDFQDVIDVNLKANFILNREAGKIMMKNRYGRVVNIASVIGFTGNVGQVNYSASKAGLVGMTKSFALEFASRGVTYNTVAPGFIDTAMTSAIPDAVKEQILNKIPMKFQGSVEDIAYGVLTLASKSARYISGTTLHINGCLYT